jgi:hypothetical protein
MTTDTQVIRPIQNSDTGADIVLLPSLERVKEFIRASKSENTLRGFLFDSVPIG